MRDEPMTTVAHRPDVETDVAVDPAPPPPAHEVTGPEDVPRRIGGVTVDQAASALGAFAAAFALVWVLYEHVLLWSGTVGFIASWWFAFLALYAAVSAFSNDAPAVRDRLMSAVVHSGALLVVFALITALGFVLWNGRKALFHANFYTHDMSGVLPNAPLDRGGIEHALVGTAIQVGIATLISMPLGVLTAIYLSEVGGRIAAVVRTVVEAMTGLPDVLAGLFVYAVLILELGWDKTGFAVALALSITMIPVVARSGEVVLRVVPSGLREAGWALGSSRWRTVWSVVLPTARAGLATSLILGIARIAGETAPLLIVSGSSTYFNKNPFHQPMNSLPFFTFQVVKSGIGGPALDRAYGAACVLLLFVLILFVTARVVARTKSGKR
jgi:phosphate transport system permease protein